MQTFASLENAEVPLIPAPTLIIDFEPAVPVAGDYNGNGSVDAADYVVWRNTLGSTTELSANGDDTGASMGIIDAADYAVWRSNFGAAGGSRSFQPATAVPEPISLVLLLIAALPVAALARIRSRARSTVAVR